MNTDEEFIKSLIEELKLRDKECFILTKQVNHLKEELSKQRTLIISLQEKLDDNKYEKEARPKWHSLEVL